MDKNILNNKIVSQDKHHRPAYLGSILPKTKMVTLLKSSKALNYTSFLKYKSLFAEFFTPEFPQSKQNHKTRYRYTRSKNNQLFPPGHKTSKLSNSRLSSSEVKNKQDELHLFIDYDGTLAPFHSDPGKAYPIPGSKELLAKLSSFNKVKVVIVTGREPEEIRGFLPKENIAVAGLHGLAYLPAGSKERVYLARPKQDLPAEVEKLLKKNTKSNKNLKLENKGLQLALHWDETKEKSKNKSFSPDSLEGQLKDMLKNTNWELIVGRQVMEIRPAAWDKGKAVNSLRKEFTLGRDIVRNKGKTFIRSHVMLGNDFKPAIYLGDDTTDEDVFANFSRPGFTVYIKNENSLSTEADYFLHDPKEVKSFLSFLTLIQ